VNETALFRVRPGWFEEFVSGQLPVGQRARGVAVSTTCRLARDDARHLALTPEQGTSPLVARPAALSSRLNVGGAQEVAERAGNSVEVLLSRYAKCLDGRQDVANRRIAELLGESNDQEDEPGAGP
jgi:hypothetical protein